MFLRNIEFLPLNITSSDLQASVLVQKAFINDH